MKDNETVQRYELVDSTITGYAEMLPDSNGSWVMYEDFVLERRSLLIAENLISVELNSSAIDLCQWKHRAKERLIARGEIEPAESLDETTK